MDTAIDYTKHPELAELQTLRQYIMEYVSQKQDDTGLANGITPSELRSRFYELDDRSDYMAPPKQRAKGYRLFLRTNFQPDEARRIRDVIRKRVGRMTQRTSMNVTLNGAAYKILMELALSMELSPSQVIEQVLGRSLAQRKRIDEESAW